MKLKFNSELSYQKQAIQSVVNLFEGQSVNEESFTLSNSSICSNGQLCLEIYEDEFGVSNQLMISEEQILENLNAVQLSNELEQDEELKGMNFTIEMETGTGKTYVYLRTIYELNKKYGFKKFVIVVPSVPIKEGVNKTLDITKEHFNEVFDNTPAQYFVYDSSKLELIRNFATSNNIEIMVINIQAFIKDNKESGNIIYRHQDKLNGEKPISLIQKTNPIVIIDEPQSVDTTDKSKEALKLLNPLCTLRYSATHVEKYNMVYKLDAVDAYEQGLVKKIEVLSTTAEESFNQPYIKLKSVKERVASIYIDVLDKGRIKRCPKNVKLGDDLFKKSGERELYNNLIVSNISWEDGNEYIEFNGDTVLYIGDEIGGIDDDIIKRFQISKTIEEHLDKEMRLNKKGIKVLSLFFIDKVVNYRGDGQNPGKYHLMFEEEYLKLIKMPKYKNHINLNTPINLIHNGYFSQDDKGVFKDSSGKTKADESTYNLIMKDKEKLLDMNTPLRFIFSHSALKEGWDNPNVFQICTLKDTLGTPIRRRQELGRGLRLCVNKNGEREYDPNINVLTVLANESYESFARGLQSEIEEDIGVKFNILNENSFTSLQKNTDDSKIYFGKINSQKLFKKLQEHNYIDSQGKVLEKLKSNLNSVGVVIEELDKQFLGWGKEIEHRIKASVKKYEIKDANNKVKVKRNKEVIENDDFKELWDKIKDKTVYSVDFDSEVLIQECIKSINNMKKIREPKLVFRKDKLNLTKNGGVETGIINESLSKDTYQKQVKLPDILYQLQNKTNLTRRTIVRILTGCDRLDDFKNNPQKFVDEVSVIIKRELNKFASKGIKYEKIGDYYSLELFESDDDTLLAYLNDNSPESKKSPYSHIVCESNTERGFADRFENDETVKVYMKLPSWFKIKTPLGNYNPDWATVIEKDGVEKLYFIIESKGSDDLDSLRVTENLKIECARKHFEILGTDIKFNAPVSNIDDFFKDF